MTKYLVLFLIIFLMIEAYSFYLVASFTGWLVAIWFSIIISCCGFSLLRKATKSLRAEGMFGMVQPNVDSQYLISAIFLIIPGFFSDLLAILALIPKVRNFVQSMVMEIIANKLISSAKKGMNMEDFAKVFGQNNSSDFMNIFNDIAKSQDRGVKGFNKSNCDEIIECEVDEQGYKAKTKD